jgi:hypothetical protein
MLFLFRDFQGMLNFNVEFSAEKGIQLLTFELMLHVIQPNNKTVHTGTDSGMYV